MGSVSVLQHVIGASAAAAAVQAAVQKAHDLDIRINAAVVDSGGNLAAFLRMPGAFLHSISIAMDKAYTAAGFDLPTDQFEQLLPAGSLFRDSFLHRPRLVAFGGGLPIRHGGHLLGGIGISGGSEDQDKACATAGLDAIAAMAGAHSG